MGKIMWNKIQYKSQHTFIVFTILLRHISVEQHALLLPESYHSFQSVFAFLFFFLIGHISAFGILVPRPGIEPAPPAVEAQS